MMITHERSTCDHANQEQRVFPFGKESSYVRAKGLWKTPPTQHVLPSCHAHRQESQMPENLACKKQSVSGHGDQTRHAKWRHEVRPGGATPVIQTREGTRARWLGPVQERRCTVRLAQVPPSLYGALHVNAWTRLLPVIFDLLPVVFDLQVTFEVTLDFRWRASCSPPRVWRVALSGCPSPLYVFSCDLAVDRGHGA